MNPAPVYHEIVEPQKVNLETYVCLFNQDWSVADHEYMPEFYPRFPKEFKKEKYQLNVNRSDIILCLTRKKCCMQLFSQYQIKQRHVNKVIHLNKILNIFTL